MSSFTLDPALVRNHPFSLAVVGCGGTGSAFASGLPYLHQAMRAQGLHGLQAVLDHHHPLR